MYKCVNVYTLPPIHCTPYTQYPLYNVPPIYTTITLLSANLGFVTATNQNMENQTLLQNEQHTNKELSQRFEFQEKELVEVNRLASDRETSIVLLKKRYSTSNIYKFYF